jgi:hypothetical protein
MYIKIKNTYINSDSIALLSVRKNEDTGEGNLIIDLNYSKSEEPVFVTFRYDDLDAAEVVLTKLLSLFEVHEL